MDIKDNKNPNVKKLSEVLTDEEKIRLVAGTDFMYTNGIPRYDIRSIEMSDGPSGLRKQLGNGDNGVGGSLPATAFPAASTLACGWNEDNLYKMGCALGEECVHYGVDILLGPSVNIQRNPLGGRNFEYFSEDPYLAGMLGASIASGIESRGVASCVKHFALNNSETYRFMGNSVCDERAMREIYLKPFEIIIKRSRPHALMCAYNMVNGVFCSENKTLIDIARGEWGFDGIIMTDWGGTHDRARSIEAGVDIEMPGDTAYCRKVISNGLNDGSLSYEKLDECVERIINFSRREKRQPKEADFVSHARLAADIATDCAVLLKNDGLLPLKKEDKIFICGWLFDRLVYQGAGSSMVNATQVITPRKAFDDRKINYCYRAGYSEKGSEKLLKEALAESENYDRVLIFVGLESGDSEGADRRDMSLAPEQIKLIEGMVERGKAVALVVFGGSPVYIPYLDKLSAVLYMGLPGQGGGEGAARLIFGESNPSGKLAQSWVKSYSSVPFGNEFARGVNELYKESVFVGYRYYCTANIEVNFPFGFGLSYAKFEYSDMRVWRDGERANIGVTLKNTGSVFGGEVVQLYVRSAGEIFKPKRQLKAFKKVYLQADESARVELSITLDELKYFDVGVHDWVMEGGEYFFEICSDCLTVKAQCGLILDGDNRQNPYPEKVQKVYSSGDMAGVTDEIFSLLCGFPLPKTPPIKPITTETRFSDIRRTFFGKIVYSAVLGMARRQLKRANKLPEGEQRENARKGATFLANILDSGCLRSMSMSAGKRMPYNYALGIRDLCNWHIFSALKNFCKKMK